ncbi:MAG: hypothetical protein ABI358_09040 [Ginsengibacter sp.]
MQTTFRNQKMLNLFHSKTNLPGLYKATLIFIGVLLSGTFSCAQDSGQKMLFVIDSVPLINDPEDWNPVSNEDIADFSVVKNKDSLKQLGWGQLDGITYIFTKAYRARPDSVKKIPGLKQMVLKDEVWLLNKVPYSGGYIDYYNSGHIQNEGTLRYGKLNGKLIVYFKSGAVKSVSDYKNGLLDGLMTQYYKNGALMQKTQYAEGKGSGIFEDHFINGQVESIKKVKHGTRYDTIITYYSTGEIRQMRLMKNGTPVRGKKEDDVNYFSTMFLQSWNAGDTKEMEKNIFHLWLLDSSNITTRFYQGVVFTKEFHFNEAIAAFDKVLQSEPLDRNALLQRVLTRLKKYQFMRSVTSAIDKKEIPLTLQDIIAMPEDEQKKACHDLLLADEIDHTDYYVKKGVPEAILSYCRSTR